MAHRGKLLATATVAAVTWGQQSPSVPKSQATGRESAAIVQEIMREGSEKRDADLRKLVDAGGEDTQVFALNALLLLHARNLEPLTLLVVSRVSDLSLIGLLSAVEDCEDSRLIHAFARACLRRAIENPAGPRATEQHAPKTGLTGAAALLLVDSQDPSDRGLLEEALKVRPNESGIWLAISKMRIAKPADLSLARAVFERAQGLDKMAAASALAPSDASAKEFVVRELTTFLSGLGQIDAQTLNSQFYAETSKSGREGSQFNIFFSHFPTVIALAYVQIPEAERLVFEFIDSPNQFVRGSLGVIAAKRWPERLMKTALTHDSERMDLLAIVAGFHPEKLEQVRSLVPPQELQMRLTKLGHSYPGMLLPSSLFAGRIF